jgi:hypothetical protein
MEVLRVVVDKRVIATHSTTMEVKSFKKAIKTAIQKATQLINRVR